MWSTGKWILFSVGLIGLLMTCPQRIYATIHTVNVVVANTVVGGVSEYNVTFTTTVALVKRKDDIFITLPSGTVPHATSRSHIKTNGKNLKTLSVSGQILTLRIDENYSPRTITVQFKASPGVTNPLTAGSYTLDVSTSEEPAVVTSNPYIITSTAGLTSATVTPTPSVMGVSSAYTISFKLGGNGALTAAQDDITLVFPSNTTVPNGLIYGITVNGTPATGIGTPGTRTIEIETPLSLANLADVNIEFASSSGLVNPTTANTYTLTGATTEETSPVTSNSYTIFNGSSLSAASVDINPKAVNTAAGYIISAQLGTSGGLTGGNDEIIITFPGNTVIPASISTSDVLVDNGTYAGPASSIVTNPSTRVIRVTPGQNVPNGANMTVILKVEAGIVNPILATQYTLEVATTNEDAVTSNGYLTLDAATTVTTPTVTLSDDQTGDESIYTINFNVGGQGRLLGGTSTISVVFPAGTDVPSSVPTSDVRINGVTVAAATSTPSTNLITVTVPSGVNIANGGAVELEIGYDNGDEVVSNPDANVTVTLQVNTSVEDTQVSSQNYVIGNGGKSPTFVDITLGTSTANTVSSYTLNFKVSKSIKVGDVIILKFPNNTTIPASISTSNIQITPHNSSVANAISVTAVPASRQVIMTATEKLRKSKKHKIELLSGAGVVNPSVPGNYKMTLRTQEDPVESESPAYTIAGSSTAVTVDGVLVAPARAGATANYQITFTVGSAGALLAGITTVTVTFPSGTTVPGSMASNTVTVNGVFASAISTNPGARTAAITIPSTITGNSEVIINFAIAAGIVNPTQGNHTLQVKTSAETTDDTSPSYTITGNRAPAITSALPNPSAINADAGYVIAFQLGNESPLAIGDQIIVDFDDLTGVPALMSAGDVRVNNTAATIAPFTDVVSKQVTVTTPVAVSANGSVTLVFANIAGLTNPPSAANYVLEVSTNVQPTPRTSPTFSITPATSSIGVTSVTPSVSTINQLATYTIDFNVGAQGALQAGSSTITVIFNESTTLGSIQASNVTVNGVQPQTATLSGQTVTVTVPTGVTVGNSGAVSLVIGSATAVITNPNTVADDYVVQGHTSVETTPIISQVYSIGTASTTVTPALVTLSSYVVYAAAQNTIAFNVGAQGALTSGSSTITINLPDDTTIPFSMNASQITVNGTPLAAAIILSQTARRITFTTPVSVGNGGAVSLVVASAANLLNPSTLASYSLQVNTSVEVTKVPSQGYTITAPSTSVVAPDVSTSPNRVNSTAQYVIGFRVGSSGGLQGGSGTITLTMPSGTVLPGSIPPSKITINGASSDDVTISGQNIVLTMPSTTTTGNGDSVTVIISDQALIQNPSIPGQYALTVATSTEPTAVASNPYTIAAATTTTIAATVVPNPATVSVTGAYTIDFNVGASGALQAGASTITLTFNSSTTVATTTVSGATINGVSAQAAADAGSRIVFLTVPTSVIVGNGEAVTIGIPSGVITNPVSSGTNTLQVKTSVEATNVTSNGYIIATAATTVTAATVTPNPNTANASAQYTISFNVGSAGALTGGSSTITTTFPNNTTIPASITAANITVNGTQVSASVTVNQGLRVVTFTTPVSISAGGSVSVVFLSAAGLYNPSASAFTLKVRTSIEATNIVSNAFTIAQTTSTVSTSTVSVSPAVVQTNAAYTVTFSVGSLGRLLGGTSKITLTYPSGTTVPGSITPASITINGVATSAVSVVGQAVAITVPASVTINNSASVMVVLTAAAGLYNPSSAASYTLTVHTSSETSAQASNSYSLAVSSTSTTPATVTPDPGQQNVNAKYSISFNTGGLGALQGGISTVTATYSAGTVPSSIATSNVTINGVNAAAVTTNSGARTVTATVPSSVSIGNNDNVSLVIGATSKVITNPTAASRTLTIRTSVEQTDITSDTYPITSTTTTVDSAFVGPNGTTPAGGPEPQTVNTIAAYNIKFKLGAQGGLTAGSGTITFTFPSYTVVPTSMIAGFITINGATVTAAPVCNALQRFVRVTVPAGASNVASGDTVTVNFSTGAKLKSPSLAGLYRLDVRTSVEATNIPAKLYTINPASTTVSAAAVTPTPNTFGSDAQYRIDVSTGSQGALVAGVSTVRVTFPTGTTLPSSIDPAEVTLNGTAASTVSVDAGNRKITVTVPSSVTIGNNGSISLIISQDAGIVNPDPGTITLQVRTSVETTEVQSGSYTIVSLAVLQTRQTLSMYPAWSPGDDRYAYISEAPEDVTGAGTGNWNLFSLAKDGLDKVQVTSAISGGTKETGDPIHFSSLTWTPEGDSLVYTGYERIIFPGADTVYTLQLYQIPKVGGVFKKISPSGAVEDPDVQFGGWLDPDWVLTTYAFENAEFPSGLHRITASLDGNIWVFEPRSTDDGAGTTYKGLVQITNLPTDGSETDGLFQPRWSPDRTRLAVVYKDSSNATLSDIYVINNVDSIMENTLESNNYGDQAFDYDTEVGSFAVNDLGDMTKITLSNNTLPSWTPSWSTDNTEIAYSQDQANVFSLNTFSTSPSSAVASTNFRVQMRSSAGTGNVTELIGQASANNAFPAMSHNGQRFIYFQAKTTGIFSQLQKVLRLQTTNEFEAPASPKILARQSANIWKLADRGFSSIEIPSGLISNTTTFSIFEPQLPAFSEQASARYIGVSRTFGPVDATFPDLVTLNVHYTEGELTGAGFVPSPEHENRLGLYYFNADTQTWEQVEGSSVNPAQNLVTGTTTKLGTFGVFYITPAVGQVFSQIMVYPNPFKPNSGSTNDGDYGTGVIFDLLPVNLDRLDIYNLAGEWVASKDHAIVSTGVPGQWRWLGTNDAGRRVASGIYLYVMEAGTERKIGKIAVIR